MSDTLPSTASVADDPIGPSRLVCTLSYHREPKRIGETFEAVLAPSGRLDISRSEPEFAAPGSAAGLPISHRGVSRGPAVVEWSNSEIEIRQAESSNSLWVNGEHTSHWHGSHNELESGIVVRLGSSCVLCLKFQAPVPEPPQTMPDLVGASPAIQNLRRKVRRYAKVSDPVLILGATGTGKELVARALHTEGPRAAGPFLAVNLGSVPEELAGAEMFGARKGSFTDARSRPGWFRSAHGGTLFLDEIGEAPPSVQAALLRVLETGRVLPIGESEEIEIDTRVVAATDADLRVRTTSGEFKLPLLHRLGALRLELPSLAERREDIGRLAHHFARQLRDELDTAVMPLTAEVVERLSLASWEGNVRELRNVMRSLVLEAFETETSGASTDTFSKKQLVRALDRILEDGLPAAAGRGALPTPRGRDGAPHEASPKRSIRELSDAQIEEALERNDFMVRATAKELEVARSSLISRARSIHALRQASDIEPDELAVAARSTGGDVNAMARKLKVPPQTVRELMLQLGLDVARAD